MVKPFRRPLSLAIAGCFLLLLSLLCVTPSSAMVTRQEIVKQAQLGGPFDFQLEDCDLPCENGGRCLSFDSDGDGIADPQCFCPSDYTGTLCESPRTCSLPCENEGSCVIEENLWDYDLAGESLEFLAEFIFVCTITAAPYCTNEKCVCEGDFYGEFCERSCSCENGGTCAFNYYDEPPSCRCKGKFYGERCEKECSISCSDAGKCLVPTDDNGEAKAEICHCQAGFEGPACEVAKPCDKPCENGAACLFTAPYGFDDFFFDEYVPDVLLEEIQDNGCDPSNYTYCLESYFMADTYCDCGPDQLGEFCEQTCEPDCLINGGLCVPLGNSTACMCGSGSSGPSCEFECSLDCSNGGVCVSDGSTESCVCQPTYEGTTCETKKPCDKKCNNGGSCADYYTWTDELSAQFCLLQFDAEDCPNGPGVSDDEFLVCECTPGWTGPYCSDPCPCQNGGSCVGGWWRRRQLEEVSHGTNEDAILDDWNHDGDDRSFYCDCPFGFTGEKCEKEIDDSECSLDCLNGGYCQSSRYDDDYFSSGNDVCVCDYGKFAGDFCEIVLDEGEWGICSAGFCLNGGTCNQEYTGRESQPSISCTCPEGVTGRFCERKPCGSGHCGYNSACIELPSGESTAAGDDYVCDCMAGASEFLSALAIGRQCGAPAHSVCDFGGYDNPNEPWVCSNGGRCYYGDSGPSCYCPSGFTGPRCEFDSSDAADMAWSVCDLPCQNGGICLKGPNKPIADIFLPFLESTKKAGLFDYPRTDGFEYCYCPEGFFGVECDKQYELCGGGDGGAGADEEAVVRAQPAHICFHGSKCQKSGVEWGCDCEGTLGAGPFCQHEATDTCGDEDASTFCVNGGACDLGSDPVCSCSGGWEGSRCEIDPSAPALADDGGGGGEGGGSPWSGAGAIDGASSMALLAIFGAVFWIH